MKFHFILYFHRASRSDSLDFQPSRPDHFDEGTWELVCKTPCSDQLLVWVSSLLVDQNGTDICSLLSVHCQVPCESSTEGIYQRILFAWHENRKRKTFFSELISPLSRLAIPGLEVNEVKKRAEGEILKFENLYRLKPRLHDN